MENLNTVQKEVLEELKENNCDGQLYFEKYAEQETKVAAIKIVEVLQTEEVFAIIDTLKEMVYQEEDQLLKKKKQTCLDRCIQLHEKKSALEEKEKDWQLRLKQIQLQKHAANKTHLHGITTILVMILLGVITKFIDASFQKVVHKEDGTPIVQTNWVAIISLSVVGLVFFVLFSILICEMRSHKKQKEQGVSELLKTELNTSTEEKKDN